MERIFKFGLNYFSAILLPKTHIHPAIILIQLLYLAYFEPLQPSLTIELCAITFLLVHRTNYFWYIGIVLQPGNSYFAVINLLVGLLSCNERQKLTLYLYLLIYFITYPEKNLHYAYNILALTGLSIETYVNLPFIILKDNLYFFCGFTCLFVHYSFNFYLEITASVWVIETQAEALLILITCITSLVLIQRKINAFINFNIDQADNVNSVFHYISILKNKVKKSLLVMGMESFHKSKCQDVDCFCRMEELQNKVSFEKLYIRKIIDSALTKFGNIEFKESLQGLYIQELLEDNKFPLAISALLKQNFYKWDIFKRIEYWRMKESMRRTLQQIESGYVWKTSFEDPFEYETNFELLRRKVMELIEIKIEFWNEIMKKSIKALKLKTLGKLYLDRLNEMNMFYHKSIIEVQKEIGIFSGGIIYNLFLLTGTNYKERAENNMKSFKKNNDPTQVKVYKLGIIKASMSTERLSLIENINSICLKMLGPTATRVEYLGRSVNELVPSCYLEEHIEGMRRFRELHEKRLIGLELDTAFLVGASGDIAACSVFFKYSSDIFNELSVITMFKHYKLNNQYIIIHDGNPLYTSKQTLDIEIVYSKEIQSILREFEFQWKHVNQENPKYHLIDPIRIQIKFKSLDYSITMSSPLSQSFTFPKKPPIHMAIHNETKIYLPVEEIVEQVDIGAMKKIQGILDNNETESQASSISRRSSIVEILRLFESNSGMKLFRAFYIGMMLIFIIIATCVSIHYKATEINWMLNENQNLIRLSQTHYTIQYNIANFISQGLSLYGISSGAITNAQYSLDSGRRDYQKDILRDTIKLCNDLSMFVKEKDKTENGVDQTFDELMVQEQVISRPGGGISFKFNNMINLAVSNCYQLVNNPRIQNLLITDLYWEYIYPFYFSIFERLNGKVTHQLSHYSTINIALFAAFSLVFILITIPIYIGKRKIKGQQNYIFDLMTSITPDLIQEDINNLQDLESNVKSNYSNSLNFQEKFMVNTNNNEECIEENQLYLATDHKRKRTGELDSTGNNKAEIFLMVVVVAFIGFLFGIFILRKIYFDKIAVNAEKLEKYSVWRNQRMDIQINLKKMIYGLRPQDLIQNKTIEDWLYDIIKSRRINFLIESNDKQSPIDCKIASIFCKNGTTSEVTVNVFFASLSAATLDQKTSKYLGSLEVITDLSTKFINTEIFSVRDETIALAEQFPEITILLYIMFWVVMLLAVLSTVIYLKGVKKEYLYLTRFITFLTEEMIKKNKRVESYLQRLMKSEQ